MFALTLRLVASLAVVVGLMLVLARIAGRRTRGSRDAAIRVLHRQPLGRGCGVAVVGVGDRLLVLGATEHQVSLLTELEPDELDPLTAEPPRLLPGPDVAARSADQGHVDDVSTGSTTATARSATGASIDETSEMAMPTAGTSVADGPAATRAPLGAVPGASAVGGPPSGRAAGHALGVPLLLTRGDGTDVAPVILDPAAHSAAPLRARGGNHRAHRPVAQGSALSGSILAPGTWRQAIAAVTGRAS